jgi:hypothetical protein
MISIQGVTGDQYIGLDNVAVNTSAVPEPTSVIIGGAAMIFGAHCWLRRRTRSAA